MLEFLPPGLYHLLELAGNLALVKKSELYLVGGTIRDLLLSYPLAKDIDLVVVGNACDLASLLQAEVGGKLTLYKRYCTATLMVAEGVKLDLATAREESYHQPASLPLVEPSGLQEDLFRRDFTINAIACSLLPASSGTVYDYFRGIDDLNLKLIRVLHPASFIDDPLRIIRAIRFEQRYKFKLEQQTEILLAEALDQKVLQKVDHKRLIRELNLIKTEPEPGNVKLRLEALGLVF